MNLSFFTLILIFAFSLAAFAQTERERGIELYKQENYSQAARALEQAAKIDKKDAEIWNMLGLAYLNNGDYKQSRKALGKAVKINPQNADYRTNLAFANLSNNKLKPAAQEIQKAIQLNPQNADAYYVRGNISLRQNKYDAAASDAERAIQLNSKLLGAYLLKADAFLYNFGYTISGNVKPSDRIDLLQKAIEPLEICLRECPQNSGSPALEEKLSAIKAFHEYFGRRKDETLAGVTTPTDDNSVTPIKILSKPRASYTDSARRNNVQGLVQVAVLFSAEGKVKYIMVLKPLGSGLTESAIKVARQIQFEPQLKDGKPVSVVKIVEYHFSLY